jgi:two-component system sensor histidine kinase PhoQ
MLSLRGRLLAGASVVLFSFLGLTGLAIDRAFWSSAQSALQDRLQANIYGLLAAADLLPDGKLSLPTDLPDHRMNEPGSGLYAQISDANRTTVWRSRSMLGIPTAFPGPFPPGDRQFFRLTAPNRTTLYGLSFGVAYVGAGDSLHPFTFGVAEDLGAFQSQIVQFRHTLWGWLGAATLLLLLTQGGLLRWSLLPLRRAEQDLAAIEAGRRKELVGSYPKELRGLTESLNTLLRSDQARVERYRHALGDLAHSLKTPLAVLRTSLEEDKACEGLRRTVGEHVARMAQIVDYQLQRAAASGRTPLAAPVAVAPNLRQLLDSLAKVYRGKQVDCALEVSPEAVFYGTAGDLLEILGNLLDNAYKWSRGRVLVRAQSARASSPAGGGGLRLDVEDDGPGIPANQLRGVVGRGHRADSALSGHGIGLATVQDIVDLYGGTLSLGASPLGGARVTVELPHPPTMH